MLANSQVNGRHFNAQHINISNKMVKKMKKCFINCLKSVDKTHLNVYILLSELMTISCSEDRNPAENIWKYITKSQYV